MKPFLFIGHLISCIMGKAIPIFKIPAQNLKCKSFLSKSKNPQSKCPRYVHCLLTMKFRPHELKWFHSIHSTCDIDHGVFKSTLYFLDVRLWDICLVEVLTDGLQTPDVGLYCGQQFPLNTQILAWDSGTTILNYCLSYIAFCIHPYNCNI